MVSLHKTKFSCRFFPTCKDGFSTIFNSPMKKKSAPEPPKHRQGQKKAFKGRKSTRTTPHKSKKTAKEKTPKNRHKSKQLFTFFAQNRHPVLNFRLFFAPTSKRQARRAFLPPFSPTKSKKHAPDRGVLAVLRYEAVACVLRPSPPSEQPWLGQCSSSHKRLNFS